MAYQSHRHFSSANGVFVIVNLMDLKLSRLNYTFTRKPLLISGKAMQHYGLRESTKDIDLVAPKEDIAALAKLYPDRIKDYWGDFGVCPYDFEIWKTICSFDYDYLSQGAIDIGEVLVISRELLIFSRVAMKKDRYIDDAKLVMEQILGERYQEKEFNALMAENQAIISQLPQVTYIDKTGPEGMTGSSV